MKRETSMISSITRYAEAERPTDQQEHQRDPGGTPEDPVAHRIARRAGEWVGEHPLVCVSMGVALGVALGWFVKRK